MRTASAIALLATAAAGAGGGKLLSVRPVANPDATLVQLEADQPLSFTTLKLLGPPRVVVDLAETEVGEAAAEQEVEDGAVRRIAVAAAGAHTTRIVIELTADVDFDVRASGTKVEVRVPRPAIATATATATATPTTTPTATTTTTPNGTGPVTPTVAVTPTVTPTPTVTVTPTVTPTPTVTVTPTPTVTPKRSEIAELRERAELPTVSLVGSQRSGVPPPPARPAAKTHASITGIGFRPQDGGEVILRSDRPLEYGVSSSDRAVLIHLPNAAIPVANNRRPLDTRVFGGTVQRVVPQQVKGGTEVRIELREPAEVHLNQTGSLLTVSFTPGS